jgi:hypothetical protein
MANNLRAVIDQAYEQGKFTYATFRKVSAIASTAGYWVDLSMTTGNPTPNYYVGGELEATIPTSWYKKGLWHGGDVSPDKKFLHKITMIGTGATSTPAPLILCDYLLYYPLIDMDSTDIQPFDNTTTLPRYTDGLGVQAFLVATNPYIGGQAFQINYTNSDGVSGRVSKISLTNTSTFIGTIVNSHTAGLNQYSAFIQLMAGDKGIRSVESITFMGANGGLACLVLVKPIATMMIREVGAFSEFDFIKDKPSFPRIYDGAYLNFLVMPPGTIASAPYIGEITTIWTS